MPTSPAVMPSGSAIIGDLMGMISPAKLADDAIVRKRTARKSSIIINLLIWSPQDFHSTRNEFGIISVRLRYPSRLLRLEDRSWALTGSYFRHLREGLLHPFAFGSSNSKSRRGYICSFLGAFFKPFEASVYWARINCSLKVLAYRPYPSWTSSIC